MNAVPLIVMAAILVGISAMLSIARRLLVDYGVCKIVINGKKTFKVTGGETLLSYFIENKIFIPSACGGKSTCGFCKTKVLTDVGDLLPTEAVFISKEEKSQGIRLACQVKVKKDIEVYFPEYLLATKEYLAVVKTIEPLTHDIKHLTLRLEASEKIIFKPGQYVQFKIPGTEEFRAYSIASSPSRGNEIELIVRLVPGGLCSTYVHEILKAGNRVTITGPYGDFFLKENSTKDIICIAGGCGMAPIRSILYSLAEKGMLRKATYFFGARSIKDLFYTGDLRQLEKEYPSFKYIPALSDPKPSEPWDGNVGLITAIVEKYVHDASNAEAYLCGPQPMIDASLKILKAKGIEQENILYDKF
jgi:Na+-transporting NADH:ubiquinone oxidoreductase subunit F